MYVCRYVPAISYEDEMGGRVKMKRTVRVHSYIIIKINRCC